MPCLYIDICHSTPGYRCSSRGKTVPICDFAGEKGECMNTLILVVVYVVVAAVEAFILWYLMRRNTRSVIGAVHILQAHVLRQEEERRTVRLNGLFHRLMRALDKAGVLRYTYHHIDSNVMDFEQRDVRIRVIVDPDRAPFELRQFTAHPPSYRMLSGSEDRLDEFAVQIHQAFIRCREINEQKKRLRSS